MGFEHSAFLLREEFSCRLRLRVSMFVHSGLSGMNTSKGIGFVTYFLFVAAFALLQPFRYLAVPYEKSSITTCDKKLGFFLKTQFE